MMDTDLKELCAVLLFLKFSETHTEEEAIEKAFAILSRMRNWNFERSLD